MIICNNLYMISRWFHDISYVYSFFYFSHESIYQNNGSTRSKLSHPILFFATESIPLAMIFFVWKPFACIKFLHQGCNLFEGHRRFQHSEDAGHPRVFFPTKFNIAHEKWWLEDEFPFWECPIFKAMWKISGVFPRRNNKITEIFTTSSFKEWNFTSICSQKCTHPHGN